MNDWEAIEAAVAINDAGSFSGAAALLKVSKSHVSRAIAQLEVKLGNQLFYRTTRRLHLTDTGRSFVDQACRLINERDELFAFAAGDGEPHGGLRITCSVAMGEQFIAPIIRKFLIKYPLISVELDLNNRIVDVIGEGFDVGIRSVDPADPRLTGKKVAFRSLSTVASPEYLKRHGTPRTVDDLGGHSCLAGTASNWTFLEKGTPRLFGPKGCFKCNSGSAVVAASLDHLGICQLPSFYVRNSLAQGRLVPVLEECWSEREDIWVVYPKRNHLLPKVRLVVDEIERNLQRYIDESRSQIAPEMSSAA